MSNDAPIHDLPQLKPPSRFRRFRFAVAAVFALLTIALVVLWVRSYFVEDSWTLLENNQLIRLGLTRGSVFFIKIGTRGVGNAPWNHQSSRPHPESPAYQWHSRDGSTAIFIPLAFFVAILAGCAVLPLGVARFSLRTLLIVTTLVALALGFMVWMVR